MARATTAQTMLFLLGMIVTEAGVRAQDGPGIVRVPEGRPILTDGVFSPGEWDDALTIRVRPDLQLLLKKSAGFVLLGLKYSPPCRSIIDLFVSPDGKSITHLHVSAQLGERLLAGPGAADSPPRFVWGATSDWYANEVRWDAGKVEAHMKQGMDRYTAQEAATFRYDGFEFQIRQSKFGSDAWLVRIESPLPPDGSKAVFPPGTEQGSTEGWLKLELGSSDLSATTKGMQNSGSEGWDSIPLAHSTPVARLPRSITISGSSGTNRRP